MLAAMFVGGLAVIGLGVYLVIVLRPNPTKEQVESRLRETLPPGYEDFKTVSYDRERGDLKFTVTYRDHFAPAGVTYTVSRYRGLEGGRGGGGWRVCVEGRKRLLERPFERWLVVEAVFDSSGKMVHKQGLTTAGPAEAAANEERAWLIALAVHGAF
ncbi:hypothetical protein [Urbifossiella limnaea]|uniref:Uncharacterized protein n=1 Tax=Urbifossiella limnaea TaxID=2528023 RepID=A0A517XSX5_9BACT|nr:hypothetical protein [Urbifossiella limnaea]QDU20592.1 hypothetical protein ETAA1_25470 [Urbifossiella limnaea]